MKVWVSYFLFFLLAIFTVGSFVFAYIDHLNKLTELRIKIPQLEKKAELLKEMLIEEQYLLQKANSPKNLLKLKEELPYMRFPLRSEIVLLPKEEKKI